MSNASREGWFIAKIMDAGVGQTKSELPQFVADFSLQKMYDEDNELVDWSQYEETITGYLVLVGHKGQDLLNCDQVKKTFDWDGKSFAELDGMDFDNKMVLIKIKEDTYESKTSLKVDWIDKEDATPGGQIKKLDSKALKDLDSKYGRKAKPKAAKPKGKATPPKSKAPKKSKAPASKPKSEGCTKDAAWDYLNQQEMWVETADDREMSEAVLIDLWSKALEEMGPDEDKFSDEDWFIIREKVAKLIFVF